MKNSVSLQSYSVCKQLKDDACSTLEVMCTSFVDRDFVLVTQVKKIGTLVNVTVDVPRHNINSNQSAHATYDTKILLGNDDDLMHVYARSIAQFVHERRNHHGKERCDSKPVLCAISVKNPDRDLLMQILDLLKPCDVWKS